LGEIFMTRMRITIASLLTAFAVLAGGGFATAASASTVHPQGPVHCCR
jgi:hypothetical protein